MLDKLVRTRYSGHEFLLKVASSLAFRGFQGFLYSIKNPEKHRSQLQSIVMVLSVLANPSIGGVLEISASAAKRSSAPVGRTAAPGPKQTS